MKKRLLALTLCLVLAMSLLPITAAADELYHLNSLYIQASGVSKTSAGFYRVDITGWEASCNEGEISNGTHGISENDYCFMICEDNSEGTPLTYLPSEGDTCYAHFLIMPSPDNMWFDSFYFQEGLSAQLDIPGYETVLFSYQQGSFPIIEIWFQLTKEHEHTWQFTQTENTLTAKCQNCDTPPVTLSLSASSVTLPDSPFNAQLAGKEPFQAAFPNAVIGDLVYKYKGSDGWSVVAPTATNAKAGEYQVGVRITIPSNNAGDNISSQNQDQIYDLYVKYTAADPAVTAQTGDNRPIELMMASIAVFSALAAAAFILDSKRRSQP